MAGAIVVEQRRMAVLVDKGVRSTLFHMAFPMLAGTFAANTYNLADAYFVSKLGTAPLAAVAFTFPVVMLITFMAGGLGTGVTALTSHAIGRGDHDDAARLVTHGITLTIPGYDTALDRGLLLHGPGVSAGWGRMT